MHVNFLKNFGLIISQQREWLKVQFQLCFLSANKFYYSMRCEYVNKLIYRAKARVKAYRNVVIDTLPLSALSIHCHLYWVLEKRLWINRNILCSLFKISMFKSVMRFLNWLLKYIFSSYDKTIFSYNIQKVLESVS